MLLVCFSAVSTAIVELSDQQQGSLIPGCRPPTYRQMHEGLNTVDLMGERWRAGGAVSGMDPQPSPLQPIGHATCIDRGR